MPLPFSHDPTKGYRLLARKDVRILGDELDEWCGSETARRGGAAPAGTKSLLEQRC